MAETDHREVRRIALVAVASIALIVIGWFFKESLTFPLLPERGAWRHDRWFSASTSMIIIGVGGLLGSIYFFYMRAAGKEIRIRGHGKI